MRTLPYPGQSLTPRELEILRGMADGLTDEEIGRLIHMARDTVKTHNKRLYVKLGAVNRAHAVAVGYRRGLPLLLPCPTDARNCLCRDRGDCRVPAEERA